MSFGTILGVFVGFSLFVGAIIISTDNYLMFLSLSSFVMVIGGTLASSFIAYEARYVLISLRLVYRILFAPRIARNILKSEVGRIIRWGYAVQKSGFSAIEGDIDGLKRTDRFLGYGLEILVSGYKGEEVRDILTNTIETSFGRNTVPAGILKQMGASAPAWGMIGTLVGLIIMLDNMGTDPSAIGEGLAIALITTLYGVLFARILLLPASAKIQQREEIVRFRNYLVAEGLVLLAERRGPHVIQDRMNSFLDPAIHFNIEKMRR